MRTRSLLLPFAAVAAMSALVIACVQSPSYAPQNPAVKNEMHSGNYRDAVADYREKLFDEGRQIFRHATFGSEDFWSGKLRLHEAIAGDRFGGVGHGLEPKDALKLGLKVDTGVLPKILGEAVKGGKVDLGDVNTKMELLKADAVVGVPGQTLARWDVPHEAIARFVRARQRRFYHDGRFADYRAVVDHYDQHSRLGLTDAEKNDLVEFLKSL